MNQKYVDADCSSVLGKSESFGNFDESEFTFMDSYLSRRQDRLERRIKRKAERIARRFNY